MSDDRATDAVSALIAKWSADWYPKPKRRWWQRRRK